MDLFHERDGVTDMLDDVLTMDVAENVGPKNEPPAVEICDHIRSSPSNFVHPNCAGELVHAATNIQYPFVQRYASSSRS